MRRRLRRARRWRLDAGDVRLVVRRRLDLELDARRVALAPQPVAALRIEREGEADEAVDGQREQEGVDRDEEQVGGEEREPEGADGEHAVVVLATEKRALHRELQHRLEEDVERRVVDDESKASVASSIGE